jgi:hypothetical protein
MKRAAVLIGVDQTGDLPKLTDAARGAALMESWAKAQKLDEIHLLTDETGELKVERVKDVIRGLVNAKNISQLIVYFAGHGVNKERNEYWLLSRAPDDSQEAINLAGSVALASTCGIPHIVFISDACRTAAEGVRAQSVRGSEIFPNREEEEKPVDVFYACQLGRPSHEVKDPKVSSAEFKAIYTHELVPALLGRRSQIVEWSTVRGRQVGRIHPRPLRDFLLEAVSSRLHGLQLQNKLIQVPMARINSDPPMWLSEIEAGSGAGLGFGVGRRAAAGAGEAPAASVPSPAPMAAGPAGSPARSLLRSVLQGQTLQASRGTAREQESAVADTAAHLAKPFGPMHHETGCGFKIRGALIAEAHSTNAEFDFPVQSVRGTDLRITSAKVRGANVLMVLDNGRGVMLPAIPDFMCALTVDDGELIDVAYEPSDNHDRWLDYVRRAPESRELRGIIAASMSQGTFHLEGEDALKIAMRLQNAKTIDPSFAVYAAHAYHDLQRFDLIRQMRDFMQGDLGATLFDVELLSKQLRGKSVPGSDPLFGIVPMLSQGWALLSAYRVKLPDNVLRLGETLAPSLWTMLEPEGVTLARKAMLDGDIP